MKATAQSGHDEKEFQLRFEGLWTKEKIDEIDYYYETAAGDVSDELRLKMGKEEEGMDWNRKRRRCFLFRSELQISSDALHKKKTQLKEEEEKHQPRFKIKIKTKTKTKTKKRIKFSPERKLSIFNFKIQNSKSFFLFLFS